MPSAGKGPARRVRVVVVGAGLGGLSAACHLAGRGHEVTVVERGATPGGLAGRWCSEGFRIDTGPSVLTMPGVLAATFAAAGADLADHLTLRPVDPAYRACFPGAEPLFARRGRAAMEAEVAGRCGPADAAGFSAFWDWLERLYRLEQPRFIDRNYDGLLDLARPPGSLVALARLGGFRRMASVVDAHVRDERLRQLLSFQALYAGLSPFDALALYCVITYMDMVGGVWFPDGGIHAVARGLAAAAGAAGAELRYGTPVQAILRHPGRRGAVRGVALAGGERLPAEAVVANVDPATVYGGLLGGRRAPRATRRARYAPSCLLWLAGVRGTLPPGTAHHNLHFGADRRRSFDDLLRRGRRQADPAMLVSVPTVTDPALAPPGGHVLYALEPVPNLDGHEDWATRRAETRAAAREDLVGRLQAWGYPVGEVVTERLVDPLDWAAAGQPRGTPFSVAHRFAHTGPLRTPNRDRAVPGLVLAGAGTVPGVGVPMVLTSGRLAAERVEELARGGR